MPAQERAFVRQTAILWPATGTDAYGQPTVGPPVEIPVRWLTQRREVRDPLGNTVMLDAEAVVLQWIAVGSRLWLGTLDEWYGVTGTGSAAPDTELMTVRLFEETLDLKNRVAFRMVGLMRLTQHG